MKTRQRASDVPRPGYSLVELLIVLGVLALMAGLALPALRGPLEKGRLRAAGREMQAMLAKTRSLAIRTGTEHWLTYEIDGRAWRIETRPEPNDVTDAADGDFPESPITEAQIAPESVMVREGDLPNGITFADSAFANPVGDSGTAELQLSDVLLDPSAQKWSEPIRFKPNGRSQDATIRIVGTRDLVTKVSLRGLTGIASSTTQRESIEPETQLLESVSPDALTEPVQ